MGHQAVFEVRQRCSKSKLVKPKPTDREMVAGLRCLKQGRRSCLPVFYKGEASDINAKKMATNPNLRCGSALSGFLEQFRLEHLQIRVDLSKARRNCLVSCRRARWIASPHTHTHLPDQHPNTQAAMTKRGHTATSGSSDTNMGRLLGY